MSLDGSLLRKLRQDPDLDLDTDEAIIVDEASDALILAAEDNNFERDDAVWRSIGQARNLAIGADLGGWTPQGIESVRDRMNEWEFDCWRSQLGRRDNEHVRELDALFARGASEAEIASFRERRATADKAGEKTGPAR